MSFSSNILPLSDPAIAMPKKKRVLLVDSSPVKRDLRSDTMRKLGIEVDCAADFSEARCWWRADLYDLVLIHVQGAPVPLDKFCNDLRSATPPQQIKFLVGRPLYLSSDPLCEDAAEDEDVDSTPSQSRNAGPALAGADGEPQRWGIMEACRRISAIRSVCDARSKAIQNRPEPLRDSEISRSNRVLNSPASEFLGEELQ